MHPVTRWCPGGFCISVSNSAPAWADGSTERCWFSSDCHVGLHRTGEGLRRHCTLRKERGNLGGDDAVTTQFLWVGTPRFRVWLPLAMGYGWPYPKMDGRCLQWPEVWKRRWCCWKGHFGFDDVPSNWFDVSLHRGRNCLFSFPTKLTYNSPS